MILRLDRLMTALPMPDGPDANAAAALQELLGASTARCRR
jgi:Mn-containing catalase